MTIHINNQSITPSTDVIQLTLTLKMTTAQVVETSVTVNNNSPIQDYVHPQAKLNLLLIIYIRTKNIRDGSGVRFKVFEKNMGDSRDSWSLQPPRHQMLRLDFRYSPGPTPLSRGGAEAHFPNGGW